MSVRLRATTGEQIPLLPLLARRARPCAQRQGLQAAIPIRARASTAHDHSTPRTNRLASRVKITSPRFSVPSAVFDESLPSKAFKLLVYLYRVSDVGGACRPGYAGMKRAMRDHDGDNGCNSTVRRCLQTLNKRGWIFAMKRTNSKMTIWLQIPHRLRVEKPLQSTISIVSL